MKILMICLGNICRSPMAEGILRHKAQNLNIPLIIDSAGTSDFHTDEHPDNRAIETMKKMGIDISQLKARQFEVVDFDNFDKIFVMDQDNLNDIIAQSRNEADLDKIQLFLNILYPNKNLPVPDPYFGGNQGFKDVYQMIAQCCDAFLEQIDKE